MNGPHLSIIIPAYNEASRLLPTLQAIEAFRASRAFTSEVIIVDDCSTDDTAAIAGGFAAAHAGYRVIQTDGEHGKGQAVKTGMLAAAGAYRVFTDADNSTPIAEVDRFFPYFDGAVDGVKYDIVIGSRRAAGAQLDRRQPAHREAAGRLYSILVRLLVLPGFLDTQCGFKMFTEAAALAIFPRLTVTGFGFDIEALSLARSLRLNVKEAPVRWVDSPTSHVRLFRDSLGMFVELFSARRG